MKPIDKKTSSYSSSQESRLKEFGDRLRAERRELVEALYEESRPGNEIVEGWQELDDPSEREIRDVEFSHRQSLRDRLRRVDKALERLSEHSYGLCDECGRQIADKRLDSDPAIALCIDCQEAAEGEVISPSL